MGKGGEGESREQNEAERNGGTAKAGDFQVEVEKVRRKQGRTNEVTRNVIPAEINEINADKYRVQHRRHPP